MPEQQLQEDTHCRYKSHRNIHNVYSIKKNVAYQPKMSSFSAASPAASAQPQLCSGCNYECCNVIAYGYDCYGRRVENDKEIFAPWGCLTVTQYNKMCGSFGNCFCGGYEKSYDECPKANKCGTVSIMFRNRRHVNWNITQGPYPLSPREARCEKLNDEMDEING